MRGVILCGGTGSRLYPLTKCINKHLLPVGGKPMAQWNIEKLVEAGITEILVVSGQEHCGSIIQQFGDGEELGCNLTYKVQSKPGGIAEAIYLAKDWAREDNIVVVLGDNISNIYLTPYVEQPNFEGAVVFLKEVPDPQRYGVAEFYKKLSMKDNEVRITSIEEKPLEPKSNFAVTGFYIFDKTVFNRISWLKYSPRGELEVTDLNMSYLKDHQLKGYILDNDVWWTDAGTHPSFARANELVSKLEY
jgi:glucose-1-phosphate thymidylyltransferase